MEKHFNTAGPCIPAEHYMLLKKMRMLCRTILLFALIARAEGGYTNHAGNVVAGWPVKLTATQVTLAERATPATNAQRPTPNDQRLTTID